jgi:hypothetical protein
MVERHSTAKSESRRTSKSHLKRTKAEDSVSRAGARARPRTPFIAEFSFLARWGSERDVPLCVTEAANISVPKYSSAVRSNSFANMMEIIKR